MDVSIGSLVPVVINVLILLFLSAVFSGAETAFTNLSPARMQVIKDDGKFASKLMFKLYQKLDLVITLNLILSNGVNIFLATYLAIFFSRIFGDELGGTLSASIGTILVIVFGEIVPKKIAILYPVSFSRATAHLLQILNVLMFPILLPLRGLNSLLDKLKKVDDEEEKEMMQEEIKATLGIGHIQGALESKEYQMMQKLLLLNDKEVKEIMTHRSDIIAINANKTLKDLVSLASKHNLSRIPIYTESIEEIEYIIHIPQLSSHLIDSKNLTRKIIDFCTAAAFKIPESKILDDLFFEFQKKRVHMAIVLNEFGQTSGLITLEDIVEQIFGEIEDETDKKEISISMISDEKARVHGYVTIEEMEEFLKINLPDEYPKHKSIGWLVLDILHGFPQEGEIIRIPETPYQIEVVDKDDEYIDQVYISRFDEGKLVN